jgi:hypothetical protein
MLSLRPQKFCVSVVLRSETLRSWVSRTLLNNLSQENILSWWAIKTNYLSISLSGTLQSCWSSASLQPVADFQTFHALRAPNHFIMNSDALRFSMWDHSKWHCKAKPKEFYREIAWNARKMQIIWGTSSLGRNPEPIFKRFQPEAFWSVIGIRNSYASYIIYNY